MSSRRTLIAVLCSALTFSAVATAGLATSDPKTGYSIKAKALKDKVNIDGTGGPITAKEVEGNIVFETNMEKINLGMDKRTAHAKDEFRCKTHKVTTLTIPKGALKMPEDGKTAKGAVNGKLKLNGETGDVKVNYEVTRTGSEYTVKNASFSFDYTNYKVKQICMLMVCVANNVDIKVSNLKLADK
jgi:polyisoprenoid-binding protein YceI